MKRIFLILCILCIPLFLFGQDPWVDSGGSTWTATSADVDLEVKDIQNRALDRGLSSFKVTVTSAPDVDVSGSSVTVTNFPSDYPDATAQSSLSSIDTNTDNTYNQLKTSVTVSDNRYSGKVSTGTAGKIFASGNISPDDEVTFISFLTEGGNAQITCTFRSGIIYIREGIPVGISIAVPVDNPTLQCTLDSGTTLYYISDEVN